MISIFTLDRVFGVMLQAALEEYVPCEVKDCPPAAHEPGIVDLDSFPAAAGGLSPAPAATVTAADVPRIGFSKNPFAGADLLRPFLTEEFLTLCRQRFSAWFADTPSEGAFFTRRAAVEKKETGFRREGERFFFRGEGLSFSPTEKKLFTLLYEAGGEAVPYALLQAVLASGEGLTVYIHALRKKLDFRFGCRLILTVRGIGYRLAWNHPEKGQ